MNNIYIGQYKDFVKSYYNKAIEYRNQIDANNSRYIAEFADEANEAVIEKSKSAYEKAKENINKVYETVREYLACANFPNVEQLTSDRLLFNEDSAIQLSANEVNSFVERYNDNFIMLRLISDWIKTHSNKDNALMVIKINLPIDHLRIYKQFADSALSLIDSIYADPKGFSKQIIDAYADEDFANELFAVIGNGLNLSSYKNSRIPESALHCFDDIRLF